MTVPHDLSPEERVSIPLSFALRRSHLHVQDLDGAEGQLFPSKQRHVSSTGSQAADSSAFVTHKLLVSSRTSFVRPLPLCTLLTTSCHPVTPVGSPSGGQTVKDPHRGEHSSSRWVERGKGRRLGGDQSWEGTCDTSTNRDSRASHMSQCHSVR